MRFPAAAFCFLIASSYVLLLDYVAFSSRSLQQALVVVIIAILILLYRFSRHSWKDLANTEGKVFFIILGTTLIQLLILSTGGLQSPFLVLIHFFMISLSFLFSFSLSLLFLICCFLIIFIDLLLFQHNAALFLDNPTLILIGVSFLPIIPLAYILSKHYHTKDFLFGLLKRKAATDEAIFSTLSEMIIVTDEKFRILSMNDSAVRTLQQSRSELLDKPLFDALLLKDQENKLVTEKTFFPDGPQVRQNTGTFTLIKSPVAQRTVTIQVQVVKTADEENSQISFIISFANANEQTLALTLDKARARYDALLQNVKRRLLPEGAKTDIMLMEKVEQDTYMLQSLKTTGQQQTQTRIDVAQLCKQIVLYNEDFANSFQVATKFNLPNFGQADIAPLTVENYPVKPEQLTGPFFTVLCDVKQLEIAIRKLFDLAILLSSTEPTPSVELSVERSTEDVTVVILANSSRLTKEDIPMLFVPYYGSLVGKTNLHNGSGLEGLLAKQVTDNLEIPLTVTKNDVSQLVFSLTLKKTKTADKS